jgi:hypothetical protein
MKNTINIEVKREQTSIERLIDNIKHGHDWDMFRNRLDTEAVTKLCHRIRIAAMIDAENIRRDANFAVNKLSEVLERMTRQLEDKPTVTFDPPKISIDDMPKIAPLAECQEGGANG